jgi:protease IV
VNVNPKQCHKFLAWAILALCLIAVPVGIFSKRTPPGDKSDRLSSDRGFSFWSKRDRILVVKLNGMIVNDDEQSSLFPDLHSASSVRRQLQKAADSEHVKAVLLRINTPGGTVAMSQELNEAVKALKASNKPIVVSMGDIATSGGYYVSSAADKIYASPGTLTGSIGVIMHLLNLSEIEKKIGVSPFTIKSGQFKDMGSMDRAPTKEEQELMQTLIMDSYDQFVTAVSEGRRISVDQVKKIADGRIYSGRQALKIKLIDALGGYEDALTDLKKTCRDKYGKDYPVDEGRSSMGMLASLIESKVTAPRIDLLKGVVPESMNSQFLHQPLWMME